MNHKNHKVGAVMVVGGGIGGMQTSLDLANAGYKVYLVEKSPSIGGRMPQLDKTFPTNDCSMCILAPKLVEAGRHPNIEIITQAEVDKISGKAGNFDISITKQPRYVNEDKCTGCGTCMENCPVRYQVYREVARPVEIELSEEDKIKIGKILDEHKDKKGPLMPVLQGINAEYRYLPADILRYISEELDIPMSHIYNIATFYNAFSLTPRGRHLIKICQGTSCHVRGGKKVLQALKSDLGILPGETTEDMRFSLEVVYCLGACALAPVVVIDDEYFRQVTTKKIGPMLDDFK